MQTNRIDEAIHHLSEAVKSKPDNADSHYWLGGAYARKAILDESIKDEKLLAREIGRSVVCMDASINEYREALRLNPDVAIHHYDLGGMLTTRSMFCIVGEPDELGYQHLDEGIAELKEAIRMQPDMVHAYYELAEALDRRSNLKDDNKEAKEAYKKFISIAPPGYVFELERARRRVKEMK
jgi:tetratricopeptide (TPR) repeat protein